MTFTKEIQVRVEGFFFGSEQTPTLIIHILFCWSHLKLRVPMWSEPGRRVLHAVYFQDWFALVWRILLEPNSEIQTIHGSRYTSAKYLRSIPKPLRLHFQGFDWLEGDQRITYVGESWHEYPSKQTEDSCDRNPTHGV
jgi:hypothetical protein